MIKAMKASSMPGAAVVVMENDIVIYSAGFGYANLTTTEPLVQQVAAQPSGAVIVASGTSCRHQLEHLTPVHPKHMAELLANAIVPERGERTRLAC